MLLQGAEAGAPEELSPEEVEASKLYGRQTRADSVIRLSLREQEHLGWLIRRRAVSGTDARAVSMCTFTYACFPVFVLYLEIYIYQHRFINLNVVEVEVVRSRCETFIY